MTSFELPDMTADALEKFLEDNGSALGLTHSDCVSLRVRRRRRSIARRVASASVMGGDASQHLVSELVHAPTATRSVHLHTSSSVCRVVVLGDDTQGKLELATFLSSAPCADARSTALKKLCSPQLLDVRLGRIAAPHVGSGMPEEQLVEVYVPPTDASAVNLRLEVLQHADVVVAAYSIRAPQSLVAVEGCWRDELEAALHLNQREHNNSAAIGGDALGGNNLSGALTAPPAVMLVGMDADARQQHKSTGTTSSKDGVRAAQALHAAKYVEVHTANASHYKAVWTQILALAQQQRQEGFDGAGDGREWAASVSFLRGLPLYEHLRAAAPTLRLDAAGHAVRIIQPPLREEGLLTATTAAEEGNDDPHHRLGTQYAYAFDPPSSHTDGNDDEDGHHGCPPIHRHRPDKLPWLQTCAKRAPSNGVLSLRPPPFPQRVCVIAVSRGMFSSDEAWLDLPREGRLPDGYINIATRTFCISDDDDGSTKPHRGRSGSSTQHTPASRDAATAPYAIRYTLDGSEPTVHAQRYLGPVALCNDVEGDAAAYAPWPSYQGNPPTVVKYANFALDAFPSTTGTLLVPGVLDAPHVSFSQHDRTLRVERMEPNAVYRYTLDGTMPSYTNGMEYTRPVMLPQRTGTVDDRGAHPVLRMVALPRLAFPSREVVLPLGALDTPSASTPTSPGASVRVPHTVVGHGPPSASPAHVGSAPSRRSSSGTAKANETPQHVFAMTRTAAARAELTHTRRLEQQRNEAEPAMMVAPGSRGASPMVNSRGSTPDRFGARGQSPAKKDHRYANESPRRGQTPVARRHSPNRSVPSHTTADALTPPPKMLRQPPITPTAASAANAARSSSNSTAAMHHGGRSARDDDGNDPAAQQRRHRPSASGVGCVADENVVEFEFPDPISLSHLTVTTPGSGQGPASYEVFVVLMDTETWMGVGSGDLEDRESVQTMGVVPSARAMPVKRVRCVFGGPSDDDLGDDASGGPRGGGVGRRPKTFVVRDMKIHGKPFRR